MSKADRRARKRQNQALAAQQRQAMAQRARRKRYIQWGAITAVAIVAVVAVVSLTGGSDKKKTVATKPTTPTTVDPCTVAAPTKHGNGKTYPAAPPMTIDPSKTYTATISTTCGTMVATLDAKNSPVAVNNFVFLANQGFYDGLKWHRLVKNFVIQGGDPKGDGSGGPGYSVKGEVPKSGKYALGELAAAKTGGDPNGTMGSQFFVITGPDGVSLPPQYAYFGTVVEGIDVARKIESFGTTTSDGTPSRALYINKITISVK